jgi:glycosyltransferase involved in cell wall biosynthesis
MIEVPPRLPRRDWRNPPVIGAMGRFVAKKGFDVFIAALGRLRSQGAAFRAVLAGDGPERLALRRLADQHGLQDVLTFPGWVDDKPTFFAGIDVFCLPSLHEPFGIVLIEAMAQGLPIVATDSEGPSEILHDGIDGVLVPRGDAERLAEALDGLIADQQHANRLGANAHRHAQATFDLSCVATRLDVAVRHVATARSNQPLEATA